jgi:hypothetical protein
MRRARSNKTMVMQRIGGIPPQRVVVTSEITMPVQLKVSGALRLTGWAKTSYTIATATLISMASTPGCGMPNTAQA